MLIAHYYPNPFMARFESSVKNHEFLHNQCTKDVDLIYCGSVSQLSKALAAKEIYKKPVFCWVWDLPSCWKEWTRNNSEMQEHSHRTADISRRVAQLKKCDKVISASKYTQRTLKSFGIESEQVYFYIDTEEIDSISAFPQDGHIIQISRFALNKRFDVSIQAMRGLGRRFVCVGYKGGEKYKALAKSLGIDVEFYCNVKRSVTIGLLKSAEMLVSPSVFEGWGITPIEALYCEVPVLLNDLEVFREVYGDAVPYHKPDDPNDMREKLRYLLADKELQRDIVKRCQPLISEFTVAKFARRWEATVTGK